MVHYGAVSFIFASILLDRGNNVVLENFQVTRFVTHPSLYFLTPVWEMSILSGCPTWAGPIYFPAVTIYSKWMCKNPRRPARQKYVLVKFGGYQPGMKFPAR